MSLTLARALVDYDLDLIQIIAAQWDVDLESQERAAAADELAASIVNAEAAHDTWNRLSDEARETLTDLMLSDGRLLYSHFVRRYGELRPMGPARREREKPWLTPENVTEALYYRGLIVRGFHKTESGPQDHIMIPVDLAEVLPQPQSSERRVSPGHAVAPPRFGIDNPYAAPDDMATLLGYLLLRDDNASLWLSDEPMPRIDRHLRRPQSVAYRALLTQIGYESEMFADDEVLTHVVTRVNRDQVRPWLEAVRPHQLRSLAEAWRDSPDWNDLAFTPGLDADEWPNDPRAVRQVVLDTMRHIPAEIWWSIDGFVDYIKKFHPDFQRPGGDYTAWYIRDAYTGDILHGFQTWDLIEGALIRFLIEGPMHWLGLVRAGRGAFSLTPIGLALLGRAEWPTDPDPAVYISIDTQGVISVPADLSRYDRVQISRFASWLDSPILPDRVSHAAKPDDNYLYRLTPQALARSEQAGVTLIHIIPFLQRLSANSIPVNVLGMLDAWAEVPDEVIIEDSVILRARDIKVYDRLRTNKRIAKWLGQPVGPNAHAVRREDLPALMNALRDLGILPLFEGHEKDNWP